MCAWIYKISKILNFVFDGFGASWETFRYKKFVTLVTGQERKWEFLNDLKQLIKF